MFVLNRLMTWQIYLKCPIFFQKNILLVVIVGTFECVHIRVLLPYRECILRRERERASLIQYRFESETINALRQQDWRETSS